MAICKSCGRKYSKFTTPVSARGVCRDCFFADFATGEGSTLAEHPRPAPETQEIVRKKRMVPIRFISFLPRSRSKLVFVLVMACYCIAITYFIATCRRAARVQSPPPSFYAASKQHPVEQAFELLVLAPIIESFVLVGVFELVRRAHAPAAIQVLTAAAFVSELHAWPWWPHAVIVFPAFCIDAGSYLYWRSRGSWKTAFVVVASIHALSNSLTAISTLGYALRTV